MREPTTFEHADNATCLNQVSAVYERSGSGQTLRHYYYKLLSSGALRLLPVENSAKNAYAFLSRLLVDAREQELVPWAAIIDPGRRNFTYWSHPSLLSYARSEAYSNYTLDPWRGQPCRLEVWVEKDAMAEITNRAVRDLRIPVYVAKGYGSATIKNEVKERYGDGAGCVLLYCGDFDPSGMDIERELRATLAQYGATPEIVRVTLTHQDTFTLPAYAALDLKEKDPRTKAFKKTYGEDQKGFELDVLEAGEVQARLLRVVSTYMRQDAFDAAIQLERAIRSEAGKRLQQAMSGFGQDMLTQGVKASTLSLSEQLVYLNEDERG